MIFFSPEGNELLNFGVEDVQYPKGDGKNVFTDKILNSSATALANLYQVGCQLQTPGVQDFEYEKAWLSEPAKKAMESYNPIVDTHANDLIYPNIKFTKEDYEVVNKAKTAVEQKMMIYVNKWLKDGSTLTDATKACEEYDAIIESMCGVDLQLLGLGHDGHIGFNEPADHFAQKTNCVNLTEMTIEANKRFFASINDVPRQAYTMGIGTIMAAKTVLMVVSGKDKAQIVKDAFFGPVTPQVPASILQFHPNFILVADEDALSLVK